MADGARLDSGRNEFFGQKTANYLKKLSRESVEKHTDTSVLYFEIDVENSKRNFYGELLVKRFVNPRGTEVKGIIDISAGNDLTVEDIPNAIANLKFSCYIEHLQELKIDPKIGDYFSTKNRTYFIFKKEIIDTNRGAIGTDRSQMTIQFECVQADDEQLHPGLWDGNTITKNNILNQRQINGGEDITGGNP